MFHYTCDRALTKGDMHAHIHTHNMEWVVDMARDVLIWQANSIVIIAKVLL